MPNKLQWHPGAYVALRIEFQKGADLLMFEHEHNLNSKPLQIDCLIIKKRADVVIEKNIGRIFRKYNIIEYKSPTDYLSINDFYRTYAYACLYQSNTDTVGEILPEELTITFLCSHYPQKLMRHLKEVRGITAERQEPGIYYIKGDPIPMQLLIIEELSPAENLWLSSLRTNLHAEEKAFMDLVHEYEEHHESLFYQSAMELIMRANWKEFRKGKTTMRSAMRELFKEEFEEMEKQKALYKRQEAQYEKQEMLYKNREAQHEKEIAQYKEENLRLKQLLKQFTHES